MEYRILIVEDNEKLAQALKLALERRKFTADIALDGIEALKAYAAAVYHLIILDIHLPRLNGIEVLKKLRQTHRGAALPVIVITGVYKGETYAERARSMYRVNDYLEKPFNLEVFMNSVHKALGIPAPAVEKPALPAPAASPPAKPAAPAQTETKPVVEEPVVRVQVISLAPQIAQKPAQIQLPVQAPAPAPTPAPSPAPAPAQPAPPPRQVASIQPVQAIKGSLKDMDFADLLVNIFFNNQSGILFLRQNGEERKVYFVEGVPLGVRSSLDEKSFGNYLLNAGKISLSEHHAYQELRQRNPEREPYDLFLKMGSLTQEEYHQQLRSYLEQWLIELFGWQAGEFVFQAHQTFLSGLGVSGVNVPRLFHEGFKRYLGPDQQSKLFKQIAQRYLSITPAFYDYQMQLSLSRAESVMLDSLDGNKTFLDLMPTSNQECEEVIKGLKAFTALGMVEMFEKPTPREIKPPFPIREIEEIEQKEEEPAPAPEPAAEAQEQAKAQEAGFEELADDLGKTLDDLVDGIEKAAPAPAVEAPRPAQEDEQTKLDKELREFASFIKDKNYYEMLGTTQNDFDFTKVKDRYFQLQRKFSPDKFITSSGDVLTLAEDVLSKLVSAYNTLSNVVSKEKYDEMLPKKAAGVKGDKEADKLQAEVAYQSGMSFMAMEDWDSAEKSLLEAMNIDQSIAEFRAHYAYALYMKNRRSKASAQKAQELLLQALKLKPKCAVAFAYRGVLLYNDEKLNLADAEYRKALSINPRLKTAIKGLKLLEQRRQTEKKGLLGRIMKS